MPVAADSPDHLEPWGTKWDNSRNLRFNRKINGLYQKQISILDLGCSGGRFVRDCIDSGNMAIGLEGSDYSLKMRRAEWRTIPERLFTCDITKDFDLYNNKRRMKFNVITAWEFMEHIKENDIPSVIKNIKKHLAPDGLVIFSISNSSSLSNRKELHQTQRPKRWWIEKFAEQGLVYRPEYLRYFNTQYVRGKNETSENFHIIASMPDSTLPPPPNLTIGQAIYDRWKGSGLQHIIAGDL
jgi:2-polyprenyl-3-methyl-5-hydroxy-6-metoxy-1,4-benzoquinol methylase